MENVYWGDKVALMEFNFLYLIIILVVFILGIFLVLYIKNNTSKVSNNELISLRQSVEDLKKIFQEQKNNENNKMGVFQELARNMQQSVNSISENAIGLKNALIGSAKYQGRMGEIGLEKLFQGYGWVQGKQYFIKKEYKDLSGKSKQPDFVVNLPDGKQLIIDCKVSFDAWYKYINEDNTKLKEENLKLHIQSVLSHIRNLLEKNYESIEGINSLDSVLMYMPNEEAFHAAASIRNDIILNAGKNKVIIVGPSTLPIMITVVDQMWKIDKQSRNTHIIVERAHEIYDKARLMTESFEEVKKSFNNANEKIDQATDRLIGRGSLIKKIESLKDLGISPKKDLPENIIKFLENEKKKKSK